MHSTIGLLEGVVAVGTIRLQGCSLRGQIRLFIAKRAI